MNAPAGRPDAFGQAALQCGLPILVAELYLPQAALVLLGQRREPIADQLQVRCRQQPLRVQHVGMCDRGAYVVAHQTLIEREVLSSGKSRAFVGNRPATASLLKDLAVHLGDIHGQHDQQQLFSPAIQREMLDAFGSAAPAAA